MCVCNTGNDCGGLTCGEGPAGADGLNSFTVTTAQFTVPAISSNVSINVSALGQATGIWAKVGEEIFIETAGYYRVVSATATVIVATNTGTTGNATAATVIAIGSGVGPGGRQGVAGATGATGAAGADGTTITGVVYSTTLVTSSSYTNTHTAITLPANHFASVVDVLRLKFTMAGVPGVVTSANYKRYRFQVFIGGVAVGPSFVITSNTNFAGGEVEMDIVVSDISTFTLAAVVHSFRTGKLTTYSITNGFGVFPINFQAITGNFFPSGAYTGINPVVSNSLVIMGRVETVGTGGTIASPGLYMPYVVAETIRP